MLLYTDARFVSPYAMSAYVALQEKGLAFEVHKLDLAAGDHEQLAYTSVSLTHRVPTLVDGDFALAESSAIAEYLEDVYPQPPILPQDARLRAQARQVQAWLRSDLLAIREERSTVSVFYGEENPPLSAAARVSANKLISAAQVLLAHGGAHLFGDWCIADTDLALMLNRLILNHDPVPANLVDYAQAQWQRPSVLRWLELPRPPL